MKKQGTWGRAAVFGLLLALPGVWPGVACAAEKALVLRAGDLLDKPFIDAGKNGQVAPNQPVSILQRQGAWAQVDAGGRSGWVRLLNLRLEAGGVGATPVQAVLLRTGSSGRTVTTGVKGLDDGDIEKASIDPAQLAQLATLAVTGGEARDNAAQSHLAENQIDYLKRGKAK